MMSPSHEGAPSPTAAHRGAIPADSPSPEADRPSAGTDRGVLRVAVVTNVLPHYRSAFYRLLFQRPDLGVTVFCQASIPGMNLHLDHERFGERVVIVPAACTHRERLGWQWLPWGRLLSSFDVLFVIGNPRILSNLVLASLARALGKPVILWGQAHSAGASPFTEGLRLGWWRWFDNLFVYTDGEARRLKARGFRRQHIVGMNNGLDQGEIDRAAMAWSSADLLAWRRREGVAERTLVLSCARLEPKNRFELWVDAMPAVIARHPDLRWAVIGDGPERERLEARIEGLGLASHVRWVGALLEESGLAPWFLSSELLVHPAGIGLTLLHAFGYGLPVVTSDDAATQMPEFDAFVPNETGLLYRHGDVTSLADAVCRCLEEAPARERMRRRGRQIARDEFNVEVMVERFAAIAKHAAASRR
jgi:glycosyltransferase involved in cell wall biosynthesis